MNSIEKVCVLGLGYVGLPTATVLADCGLQVLGVDIQEGVVQTINAGEVHISEPGLEALVNAAVRTGHLSAALQPEHTDVFIIAVPTLLTEDNKPDLSYLESALGMVAQVLQPGNLIIIESSIPPGTCLSKAAPLVHSLTGLDHNRDYLLAHCPERLTPGKILQQIIQNDRIIGGTTSEATQRAVELYSHFVKGRLLETDATTAEMAKLMENTYRDVNIALANEFSTISESLGINPYEAISLANTHPTVNIHTPGIGVGGHCLPVVPWFIVDSAPHMARLIPLARTINDERPGIVAQRILRLKELNPDKKFAFFGLSFKADTDDLSGSPAVQIVKRVAEVFTEEIDIVEPYIRFLPKALEEYDHLRLVSCDIALQETQVHIRLVNHRVFEGLNLVDVTQKDEPSIHPPLFPGSARTVGGLSMNFHIRKASIDDLETLLGLGEKLWREELTYEEHLLYAIDDYRKQYVQQVENEYALFLIAEMDDKPAGYLYAHIDPCSEYLSGDDLECEVEVVYLEAWARGRGLAQGLFKRCLEWSKEKNVKSMKTGIFAQNTASLKAFKKCGFEDYHVTLVRKME